MVMEVKAERNSFSEESGHRPQSRSSSYEPFSPGLPRKRRHVESTDSVKSSSDWSNASDSSLLKGMDQPDSKVFKTEGSNQRSKMLEQVMDIIKGINKPNELTFENLLPEFCPERRTCTISKWLDKVDQCAEMYGWSETEKIQFALEKLAGSAKVWYEECGTGLYKWSELRLRLEEEFRADYAELLSSMLELRVMPGDSLVSYYYEKMGLLNTCDIDGRKAVDCLLDGIDDDAVRIGAHAARLETPEHVIKYFQAVEKAHVASRPARRKPSKRCSNCGAKGHRAYWCYKPKNKCSICSKWGHLDQYCWNADAY